MEKVMADMDKKKIEEAAAEFIATVADLAATIADLKVVVRKTFYLIIASYGLFLVVALTAVLF